MSQRLLAGAFVVCAALGSAVPASAQPADVFDRVTHGYADSHGVKIHYATLGKGPLVVLIHGFPDFWYVWRNQIAALADNYQVVAIDQRGFNQSDKPQGLASYDTSLLVGDVAAVIAHFKQPRAVIVGHDWGGFVAWHFAEAHPELTSALIVLNLPHPRGLMRELATNPDQQKNSEYARRFQQEGSHKALTAEALARHTQEPAVRARYIEALKRTDFEATMHYYQQNYPKPPYAADTSPVVKIKAPVLVFHGLQDPYLLAPGLNGTWEWVERDLTIVTVPGVGHWVQEDASELVSSTMKSWLAQRATAISAPR